MAYKKPVDFAFPLVDKNGMATPYFQSVLTQLLQAVATAEKPQVLTVPLAKITGAGAAGSLTIDYQGVVVEMVAPT